LCQAGGGGSFQTPTGLALKGGAKCQLTHPTLLRRNIEDEAIFTAIASCRMRIAYRH
ncbi:MAG: hypothetical protein F6K36_30595, partial [Symploca sp. SIO3C6]|nr:hypothetical protein [Symploca sp. SIO3C6]